MTGVAYCRKANRKDGMKAEQLCRPQKTIGGYPHFVANAPVWQGAEKS